MCACTSVRRAYIHEPLRIEVSSILTTRRCENLPRPDAPPGGGLTFDVHKPGEEGGANNEADGAPVGQKGDVGVSPAEHCLTRGCYRAPGVPHDTLREAQQGEDGQDVPAPGVCLGDPGRRPIGPDVTRILLGVDGYTEYVYTYRVILVIHSSHRVKSSGRSRGIWFKPPLEVVVFWLVNMKIPTDLRF